MSVVNQMLKDLEQRKSEEQNTNAVYKPSAAPRSRRLLIIALVLLTFAVVGISTYVWLLKTGHTDKPELTEPVAAQNRKNASSTDVKAIPEMAMASPPTESALQVPAVQMPSEQSSSVPELETRGSRTQEIAATAGPAPNPVSVEQPAVEPRQTNPPVSAETQQQPAELSIRKRAVEPQSESNDAASSVTLVQQSAPSVVQKTTAFSKNSSAKVDPASSAKALREQARVALKAGQEETAIAVLQRLIEVEPDNISARKKLAAVLFSRGQELQAKVVLEQGIVVYPDDTSMRLMLARLLVKQNDNNAALAALNPQDRLSNESMDFLAYRASLAEKLGEHAVAYADYVTLSSRQPNDARWWLGRAVAAERVLNTDDAIAAYNVVIRLDQLNTDVKNFARQRLNLLVVKP